MEYSRGGRGFMKGKLRSSLYRTSTNKVTPSAAAAADQGGLTGSSSVGKLILNQEQVTPQLSKHVTSVSLYLPSPDQMAATAGVNSYNPAARMATLYSGAAADEAVDLKAANYISSVRQRFSLEY